MAGRLRRIVQLILDKDSALRVQQDSKRALDKGTDPTKPTRNLKKVEGGFGKLLGVVKRLVPAMAAAFAVRQVKRFLESITKAAAESEEIWNRLAGQLRAAGVEFRAVEGEIRASARALQDVTTIGDEDFAEVLRELVSINGDYAASLREVQTVADLAAAKKLDLRTAAMLVGRAMIGETSTLSRYGLQVQEGVDVMETLRAKFAGMAENEANSLNGKLVQINNEWGDFKQAMGFAVLASGDGTSALDQLRLALKGATEWVENNRGAIAFWGRLIFASVAAVTRTVTNSVEFWFNWAQVVGSAILTVFFGVKAAAFGTINAIAGRLNWLIEQANRLPGVDIDFRFGRLPVDQALANMRHGIAATGAQLRDMGKDVLDVADAWKAVMDAARGAGAAQAAAAGGGGGSRGGSGGGGADAPAGATSAAVPLEESPWVQRHRAAMDATLARTRVVAEEMTDAFQGFFDAAITGFDAVGGAGAALEGAVRGVGAAIVRDLAEGKAEFHMAEGVGKLASGLWPPNPAAIASAAKHFAAAAAFRALPGLVGGGSRGSGGGGLSRGGFGSIAPVPPQPTSPETHIYMDPLRADDPAYVRTVMGALGEGGQTFGHVQVHPYAAGRRPER